MIPYYYDSDLDYANKRLSNTGVLGTKGELFFVKSIENSPEGKTLARVCEITTKEVTPDKFVTLDRLDMTPVNLGYLFCTTAGKAAFLVRKPMRSTYKQGFYTGACESVGVNRGDISWSDFLMPIFGNYPTLKEAFNKLETYHSYPFSRFFALSRGTKGVADLYYRGDKRVGEASLSNNGEVVLTLFPKFTFLQQQLDWCKK